MVSWLSDGTGIQKNCLFFIAVFCTVSIVKFLCAEWNMGMSAEHIVIFCICFIQTCKVNAFPEYILKGTMHGKTVLTADIKLLKALCVHIPYIGK